MSASPESGSPGANSLPDAIEAACRRIAPSWPLDRFIAVNPHWGWIDRPIEAAAASIGVLAGMRLLPGITASRQPLVAELAGYRLPVIHQISQHCAACFDMGQSRWHLPASGNGLYRSWLERIVADRGLAWPQGRTAAQRELLRLPGDAPAAIAWALRRLDIDERDAVPCLTAWLLDVNGWAAACAWHRWQARLGGRDDSRLVDLLAIRACWDALLADALPAHSVRTWAGSWQSVAAAIEAEESRQQDGWASMEAGERQLQRELIDALSRDTPMPPPPPRVQAIFCIDVRSEVFRRALEQTDPSIATRGFAGFFGLPVDHRPFATDWQQPQLPGLVRATLTVDEDPADASVRHSLAATRRRRLAALAAWRQWRLTPAAGFSFVEACGAVYAGALLRSTLPGRNTEVEWTRAGLQADEAAMLHPHLTLDTDAGAALAAAVLRAMGLVQEFAPLVLLCGHGSQSANNPHAAGLDCGACGGRSGEVNARALASLLNDAGVRAALADRGIVIPAETWFVAGLHNTATDEVRLYDADRPPASHAQSIAGLGEALAAAGRVARAERAPTLGEPLLPDPRLLERLRTRAAHWAETRPEWGLVDNAAFIAAPRARTRGLNLGGRVFLHDYDAALDTDRTVLAQILSAPVVVAHWINLQYLASTVDPERHGAGNKLLHNVVGAGVGVFEGNGGDLRIGLPWQSVHDGTRLRHTPRRLSVFVEAPRESLDAVIAGNITVRQLVDHRWLHLFAIDADGSRGVHRRVPGGGWQAA